MWRPKGAWVDAAALAAVAAATRLPFVSQWLWAWDSVLYARAIGDFHLGAAPLEQRPHPPGYVFYVLGSRALSALFGGERAGLVAFSVLAGTLAVVLGYLVGRAVAGRRAGILTAVVLLADPLLWQASAIAYPYVMLALFGGVLGLLAWRARTGSLSRVVVLSATFGLALGFRQDLALHVGLLWAWTVWVRGARATAVGAASAAVASLAWLVPSAAAAGGLDRYVDLVLGQATYASFFDGVPPAAVALPRNLRIAAEGLLWQLLWLWPLAVGGALVLARERRAAAAFLAIWSAPSVVTLLVLHTGEPGYTLALAIPAATCVGVLADRALSLPSRRVALAAATVTAALVVLLGATFAFGHGRFSAYEVRRHDHILAAQVAHIRATYSPRDTVIVGGANYFHALWYLPEFQAVYAAPRREGGRARDLVRALAGLRSAVLFDDTHPALRRLAARTRLSGDVDLYVITVGPRVISELETPSEEFLSLD